MSVLDANFGMHHEPSVAAAWADHARASVLAEGKQFTRINIVTELTWLGGPAMKEFHCQIDSVVRKANELVDSQLTAFERELLTSEKQKYQDELDHHQFDANMNKRLPEPGRMMQERARRVRETITKIAAQSRTVEVVIGNQLAEVLPLVNQTAQKAQESQESLKTQKTQKTQHQATTGDRLPAVKSNNETVWARLGFTSPDVLAFDQVAPSRAESKLGKFWEDIKEMFWQSDTVNDRLKKAVESKLTAQERIELARQQKEFYKEQMESLRSGLGWGAEAPDLADYPLIAKRDQMLRDAEQNICKQVRSMMTAAEKRELDDQFLRYAEAMRSNRESSVFKSRPQPGEAILNFFKSVGEAVENYGRQQAA